MISEHPAPLASKPHWSHAQPWQTNAALCLLGLCLFLLSRHLISEYDTYTIGFSGVSSWSVWCYVLASALVLFGPIDRLTFPIILTVAVLCRLATLFADPFLSSDIYRYVWDGIVQHAGINPYRYVPADPHLAFLRPASDSNIFPNINRADYAHTIYPPFAQMLFWLITFLSPTVTCMKTVMVLFEGLTLWTILKLLHGLGRPREQAILYAWCPLLIWEIAGSGHLDSAAMALIGLALLSRYHRRPVLTGLFLALAVLTKLYPLVLFPAIYLRRPAIDPGTGQRRTFLQTLDWQMPATMLALAIPAYALYSSVGKLVFGFLGGYVQEEGMATGARYFLLEQAQHLPGLHNLSPDAYLLFAALVLAALSVWAFRTSASDVQNTSPESSKAGAPSMAAASPWVGSCGEARGQAAFLPPAFALAAALMLLFSPHYPWYVAWLIPFLALLPNLPMLAYILGLFYLCTTALAVGAGPKQFLLNQILYGGLLLATLLHLILRRWYPKPLLQSSQLRAHS